MRDTVTAHAYMVVVEDRISELWTRRRWYATHHNWIPEQQTEDRAELRLLVGLARKARALAAPAIEQADEVTMAKAFADPGLHYAGMS